MATEWTLSASATSGGYVSPTSMTVNEGETATITAYPYSGYTFDYWIREGLKSYANPYMAIMYRNISITAYFRGVAPPPVYTCPHCGAEFASEAELNYHIETVHPPVATYHLSVHVPSWAAGGYIDPGSGDYPAYSTVTLRAYPLSGYQFLSWGRDASGTSPTYNLYMNSDKNVEAYFEKIPVPEYRGTITKMELEYDGARALIPAYNIPQGERGLIHIWGLNDMATTQALGIGWVIFDPDGLVVEEYNDWSYGHGPDEDHEFIGGRFPLDKAGTYIISVVLKMSPPPAYPTAVDTYYGTLCTVGVVVPEPEFAGFSITEYTKR